MVPVHGAGIEDGRAYLVMRYVEGHDLRTVVLAEGPLTTDRATRIAEQLGEALDAIHHLGYVHRDLKPQNVMVDAAGHVYLSDFGLAKQALATAGDTRSEQWVGTLDYVAPEQIRGERVDARADVYSFGGVLYFMLTAARAVRARERPREAVGAPLRPAAAAVRRPPGAAARARRRRAARDGEGPGGALPVGGRPRPLGALGRRPRGRARAGAHGRPRRGRARGPDGRLAQQRGAPAAGAARAGAGGGRADRWPRAPPRCCCCAATTDGDRAPTATPARRRRAPRRSRAAETFRAWASVRAAWWSRTGDVWVISIHEGEIARLDVETGKRARAASSGSATEPPRSPRDGDMVWIANRNRRALIGISARTGRMMQLTAHPGAADRASPPARAASGSSAATEVDGPSTLYRYDRDGTDAGPPVRVPARRQRASTLGGGYLWVALERDRRVMRIGPGGRARARRLADDPASELAYGAGHLWASIQLDDAVARIDPRSPQPRLQRRACRGRSSWSSRATACTRRAAPTHSVVVHPPADGGAVERRIKVPPNPYGVAAGAGRVWVTGHGRLGTLTRIDPVSTPGLHRSTPLELKERLDAERRGTPFLLLRDGDGAPADRGADRRRARRSRSGASPPATSR